MIERIQHATASSPEGAKGIVKGVLACAFQNMAFMLPTGLLYLLVKDLLAGSTSGRSTFYLLGCVACFALILLTTWFQYNGTYFTTYKESGTRRLTLAERLRKLPLSFFGKRDLADLTSTIMADCEVLEKDCSHFIPGLFGSLISTALIALSLFAFEWRMALAALWVIPVSAAIVVGSYRVQDKVQARTMAAKMACADGIQEYIETLRDLKASNAEQRYLSGLSDKIRAVEKQSITAELETALFVSSSGMVLKLGIASVALTGSVLLVQGSINVLTLFLFLMAASRMYNPMQGALQNLAAAKLANCEEFAEKLPDKWNTNIGENGCALSGGERQRISIARAFLKDAPIILLDEATASLDVENETAIQEALSRLIKNKTVLIIAHRMRTVAGADQVVVLSGGIVAEQGSPAELYARKGLYAHMVDLQSTSQSWTL